MGTAKPPILLSYYLGRDQILRCAERPESKLAECPLGGYRVVSSKLWFFDVESFRSEFKRMRRAYALKDGERVWIVQIGWGETVYSLLANRLSHSHIPGVMFGENLAVFPDLTGPG